MSCWSTIGLIFAVSKTKYTILWTKARLFAGLFYFWCEITATVYGWLAPVTLDLRYNIINIAPMPIPPDDLALFASSSANKVASIIFDTFHRPSTLVFPFSVSKDKWLKSVSWCSWDSKISNSKFPVGFTWMYGHENVADSPTHIPFLLQTYSLYKPQSKLVSDVL